MISRLISKQRHHNFLHEYGVHRDVMQYDVYQLREIPDGWMKRVVRVRWGYKSFGPWRRVYSVDPVRPFTNNYGNYYISLSQCALKRRLKKDGLSYR